MLRAGLTDAAEAGAIISRDDLDTALEPVLDAMFGHQDPRTGRRVGGLVDDVAQLRRRSSWQLTLQTITAAAVPIAVAWVAAGGAG